MAFARKQHRGRSFMLKPQCWPTLDEIAEVTDRVWASPMYERLDLLLRTDDVRRWGSETTVLEPRRFDWMKGFPEPRRTPDRIWGGPYPTWRDREPEPSRREPVWVPAPAVTAEEARAREYQREADVMRRRLEELYIFLREQQEQQHQRLQADRIKDWNLL